MISHHNLQPNNLATRNYQVGIDILKNQIRTCMFPGRRMSECNAMSADTIERILLVRLRHS